MCHWDEEKRYWSTEGFYDSKHQEEQQISSVKTRHLGVFALAQRRFSNYPYQSWDLKPVDEGSVSYTVAAAVVTVEFIIKVGRFPYHSIRFSI